MTISVILRILVKNKHNNMRVTGTKKNPNLTSTTEPQIAVVTTTNGVKPRIHNVFIVDASGSMAGSKYENAISGVNELLKSITTDVDTENNVMIVEFEGNNIITRLDLGQSIPKLYEGMGTDGMTPLNQAIGQTLEYVEKKRKNDYDVNDKVLVNIFTDGGENSSSGKYRDPKKLSEYIKILEDKGFTITFIGTQAEVNYAVQTLSMDSTNTLVHTNTAASVKSSFDKTLKARSAYSKSVARGEDVKAQFYTKTLD